MRTGGFSICIFTMRQGGTSIGCDTGDRSASLYAVSHGDMEASL
jgi:hypothetical protein